MSQATQSPPSTEVKPTEGSLSPRKDKRVLIVEGDGITRLKLMRLIRMADLKVDFASNGYLALRNLRRRCPDAILLDLKLRGIQGIELIQAARRDPQFGNNPIYVFTWTGSMNRKTRKATQEESAQVFDKLSTPPEWLALKVAADLTPAEPQEHEPPAENIAAGLEVTRLPDGEQAATERALAELQRAQAQEAAKKPASRPGPHSKSKVRQALTEVKKEVRLLSRSGENLDREAQCARLRNSVKALLRVAATEGRLDLARKAEPLESFLKLVGEQPKQLADSSLTTIECAVETLEMSANSTGLEDHRGSVVVIDQDSDSMLALTEALAEAGVDVKPFEEPLEALKHIESKPTPLIIINLLLPELHGLELKNIRELPLQKKTPVIFVPNPSDADSLSNAMPMSSTRLDINPITNMEILIKALNLVQKAVTPGQPASTSAERVPTAPSAPPATASAVPGEVQPLTWSAVPAVEAAPDVSSITPPDVQAEEPVANTANPVVFLANHSLQILEVHPSCRDMFDQAPKDLVGQKLDTLLVPGIEREIKRVQQKLESSRPGESCSVKVVARRKEGTEFPAELTFRQRLVKGRACWAIAFQELPAEAVQPAAASVSPVPASASVQEEVQFQSRSTVLFVEDDPLVLRAYQGGLEREGFNVELAEDGLVAVEKLPRVRPDVVVLDLMLPKLHGLEVLRFIRADAKLKNTPVIVLSNAYMEGLISEALQAGANRGLPKTECTPRKLAEAIRKLLGLAPEQGPRSADAEAYAAAAAQAEETACQQARRELLKEAPQEIAAIRQECLNYIRGAGSEAARGHLENLYQRIRTLSGRAWLSGYPKVSDLASAFEALLYDLLCNPSRATPSVLQTMAQAVESLSRLFQTGKRALLEPNLKAKILAVDLDSLSNQEIVTTLRRVNFDAISIEDPSVSMQMLQAGPFDLVILGIDMLSPNGFEICEQLRRMPEYKSTPVLFLTASGEFQERARSILAGGNDLITKPVYHPELALKVLLHLMEPQEQRVSPAASGAVAAGAPAHLAAGISEARAHTQQARGEPVPPGVPTEPPPIPRISFAEPPVPEAVSPLSADPAQSQPLELQSSADIPETPIRSQDDGNPPAGDDTEVREELQALRAQLEAQGEELAKHEKERGELVSRVYERETELHLTRGRLERRGKAMEKLEKDIEELTAANAELKKSLSNTEIISKQNEHTAADLSNRMKELGSQLSRAAAELQESKADRDRQAAERARLEADLRQQLEAATNSAKQAEASRKESQARSQQLEQELAALKQAREELGARYAKEQQASQQPCPRVWQSDQRTRIQACPGAEGQC